VSPFGDFRQKKQNNTVLLQPRNQEKEKQGVCHTVHCGLAICVEKYLKAKEEL